jgi:hypothetical protein
MAIDKAQKAFQDYVDTASDLAESVKRNIVHEGIIDDETVLKLNAFIIASNAMADLPLNLTEDSNESDETLN